MTAEALEEALIYRKGSPFQRWAYEHAARHFHARGVRRYGRSGKGTPFAHLLDPADAALNFLSLDVARALAARFDSHKAGDRARAETNTVASQPCCFNLFAPLAADLRLASKVFTELMSMRVDVDHIELEFTPNQLRSLGGYELSSGDESLGDQRGTGGTDADLAVFYRAGTGRGVLLLEFKYIESEFSTCGSYATPDPARKSLLRPLCNSSQFTSLVTEPRRDARGRPLCGYTKYRNWELTRRSKSFDWERLTGLSSCPFAGSAQQLWRNLLLAEHIAWRRQFDDFGFWVVSPRANDTLWSEGGLDVFHGFTRLLRPAERRRFRRLETETVLAAIDSQLSPSDERRGWWLRGFRERYLPSSEEVLVGPS